MPSEATSDAELVDRCNAGDEQAFEAMYHRHNAWVFALAVSFLGNQDDAADVLQEVFTDFFRRFPGFRLTSSLRAYLYPAVKHRSISRIRRRRSVVPLDGLAETLLFDVGTKDPQTGDFERLLETLPHPHQEVLVLRFLLDMKIAEIASALDIPAGTVKSRLHNALKRLRIFSGAE